MFPTSPSLSSRIQAALEVLANVPHYTRYDEWLTDVAVTYRRLVETDLVLLHAPPTPPDTAPLSTVLVGGTATGQVLPLTDFTNAEWFENNEEGRERMFQFGLTAFSLEGLTAGDTPGLLQSPVYQVVLRPNGVRDGIGIMLDGRRFRELASPGFAAITGWHQRVDRDRCGEEMRLFLDAVILQPLLGAMSAVTRVLPAARSLVAHHDHNGTAAALWRRSRGFFELNSRWRRYQAEDPNFGSRVHALAVHHARAVVDQMSTRSRKSTPESPVSPSKGVATERWRYTATACLAPAVIAGAVTTEIVVVALDRQPLRRAAVDPIAPSLRAMPSEQPLVAPGPEAASAGQSARELQLSFLRRDYGLTRREAQALMLRADGKSHKEAAAVMGVGRDTFNGYMKKVSKALGSPDPMYLDRLLRAEAVPLRPGVSTSGD